MELGAAGEQLYKNLEGKTVRICFRGLHDLNVIHDQLEHGAELTYWENPDWDEIAIHNWLTSKESLGVFQPITPSKGPNYFPREVMEMVDRLRSHSDSD